jgi:hypothetical protein
LKRDAALPAGIDYVFTGPGSLEKAFGDWRVSPDKVHGVVDKIYKVSKAVGGSESLPQVSAHPASPDGAFWFNVTGEFGVKGVSSTGEELTESDFRAFNAKFDGVIKRNPDLR